MDDFWNTLIARLGRRTLYVDSGAILGDLEHGQDKFKQFFRTAVGWRYVTSTYVVTETVRRLVKTSTPHQFRGPRGERRKELSLYVLTEWLQQHNVYVICLPEEQFRAAEQAYRERQWCQCDLTDMISCVIVECLQRNEILSDDHHFSELGLTRLP